VHRFCDASCRTRHSCWSRKRLELWSACWEKPFVRYLQLDFVWYFVPGVVQNSGLVYLPSLIMSLWCWSRFLFDACQATLLYCMCWFVYMKRLDTRNVSQKHTSWTFGNRFEDPDGKVRLVSLQVSSIFKPCRGSILQNLSTTAMMHDLKCSWCIARFRAKYLAFNSVIEFWSLLVHLRVFVLQASQIPAETLFSWAMFFLPNPKFLGLTTCQISSIVWVFRGLNSYTQLTILLCGYAPVTFHGIRSSKWSGLSRLWDPTISTLVSPRNITIIRRLWMTCYSGLQPSPLARCWSVPRWWGMADRAA